MVHRKVCTTKNGSKYTCSDYALVLFKQDSRLRFIHLLFITANELHTMKSHYTRQNSSTLLSDLESP